MSSAMEIILLERVDSLGQMGDVVKVKSGFARNYLLPQSKALRATKSNIAYFEGQKESLVKLSDSKQKDAEKLAKKFDDVKVSLIRHASESGHLYGSANSRDIAEVITEQTGETITRQQVVMNDAIKAIGLIPVTIALHPEVKVTITLNIARSEEEAKIQQKTGRALVAGAEEEAEAEAAQKRAEEKASKASEAAEASKEEFLEDGALEAEKEKAEEDAVRAAEDEVKAAERAEKKAVKDAAEAEKVAAEEAAAEADSAETSTEEDSKDA